MSEKQLKAAVLLLVVALLSLIFVLGRLALEEDKSQRHVAQIGPVFFPSTHGTTRVRLAVVCSNRLACDVIEDAKAEVEEVVQQAGMAHMRFGPERVQQEIEGRLQILALQKAKGGKVEGVFFNEIITTGVI